MARGCAGRMCNTQPQGRIIEPGVLSVALIWGGNFVVYKLVLRHLTPLAVVGTRFALLTPLLLLATRFLSKRPPPEREDLPCLVLAGLVVLGGQQVTFIFGVDMSSATEAALLISTAPIFTAIISVLSGQERLSLVNWIGVIVGFAGVAMVVGGARKADLSAHFAGDLVMLASAMLYGYYMVLSKHLVVQHGGLRTVAYSYALASVLLVPVAYRDLVSTDWFAIDALTWLLLVGYICFLAGLYGFAVWYTTIGRTTAARTAVYQYLVPVVAMASAATFLGERLTALQMVGAATVLAGLVLTRLPAGPGGGGP